MNDTTFLEGRSTEMDDVYQQTQAEIIENANSVEFIEQSEESACESQDAGQELDFMSAE